MKPVPIAAAIELVVLSAWLGAALLLATSVAPQAFAVLPTRALAGALVGGVLPVVFIGGIVAAIIAVVCETRVGRGALRFRVSGPLLGLAGACAIAQFVIAPKITRLRDAVGGPIDALDPADPRRAQFGSLHGFSMMWMGIAMLGAVLAIALQVKALRNSDPTIYSSTGERVT